MGVSEEVRRRESGGSMKKYAIMTVGSLTASLLLTLAMPLHALTVGDIAVLSRQGEPFRAEVPLGLGQHDLERGVRVVLGNEAEYGAEGLSRSAMIDRLSASLVTSPRDVVRIESTVAVEESSLDIVLLVRSGLVTIVRSYRVALPPAALPGQTAQQESEVPQQASTPPAHPASAPLAAVHPSPQSETPQLPVWMRQLPAEYGPVRPGGTLTSIVRRLGVPDNVRWQTIVRLWEANRSQFMGENMHGIRVGTVLRIPSDLPQSLASLSQQEAQRIIVEQWEAWQGVRQATGRQQTATLAPEQTNPTTAEPAPVISHEVAQAEEAASVPDENDESMTDAAEAGSAELPPQQATVVLPARQEPPATDDHDVSALLQGLEQLLARRRNQPKEASNVGFFVRSADLQAAIEGLEERLTKRLQNSLGHVALAPQAPQPAKLMTDSTQAFFDRWLPESSMAYVLLIENALLLLLAVLILVRWSRGRAY
jgi:pilus assembly protein FimV